MSLKHLTHAVRAISRDLGNISKDSDYAASLKRFGAANQHWWKHENVVGLCIGRKRRRGRLGTLCVQVLVKKKFAPSKVSPKYRVPGALEGAAFPRPLLTDVRQVGGMRLESLVSAERPAQPGFDIGNELGGSGTLGCAVVDASGRRLGLSCAHVLAPDGVADVGASIGGTVLCPSLPQAQDLGLLAKAPLGTLVRVLAPSFDPDDAPDNLDAAVFLPSSSQSLTPLVADLGVKPKGSNDSVRIGLSVHKVGAVTGETKGVVQAVALAVKIPYGEDEATFVGQIGISSFTQPGDSGSLVLDDSDRAVGIHLGAVDGMSICTPIERILSALDCTLA
jgi:hypothetical protein